MQNCSIYIHIPFCKSKCYYCDYNSIVNTNYFEQYFKALNNEIELYKNNNFLIKTIYIGGGTPSFVDSKYIKNIFYKINEIFNMDLKEFTIEVNPESVEELKLIDYKEIGINRISMGIQSSSNKILKTVNRIHTLEKARKSYYTLKKYFKNINLDFILGLPFETEKTIINNLNLIKELNPQHISYYLFDSSHETPLMKKIEKKELTLPNSEFLEDMLDIIYIDLKKMNYNRYEISSWSKDNNFSIHNKVYWKNENYIGFGVSAGSHISKKRYVNTDSILKYINSLNKNKMEYEYYHKNDEKKDFIETIFMGLRLLEGISIKTLKERYSEKLVINFINKLTAIQSELISIDETLKLTEKGLNLSNRVFENLIEIGENI
ncbi:coproporphyrinogen III oxidase [Tepiditoga spiralis]|uniref:Heme chaperone HemW n=1 Tax=Tepiditoga spiralis TaxID=2108365 RepID=A0A7G1G9N8_9BACT|nr:radical SAM family heme chaperone HemW [Tepiditoga spiralis]BBE31964.1 coproporphyrinogen III oxidase [Tepiditoga spiralis]